MKTIEKSIIVNVPVATAYNQWTQFEDFPHFMEGVKEVRQMGEKRLHWKAEIAGRTEEWDAEIYQQIPDGRIAWRSVGGAKNSGQVVFNAMSTNQTEVFLQLHYDPEGVAEILWGASPKDAQKMLLTRKGVSLVSASDTKLVFAGGNFAEQNVAQWELRFNASSFREAAIRLKPAEPLRQYEALRKLITAKYRKAGREERENAIHRATYWDYSGSTGKWGIVCDTNAGGVTLVYKDKSEPARALKPKPKDL